MPGNHKYQSIIAFLFPELLVSFITSFLTGSQYRKPQLITKIW